MILEEKQKRNDLAEPVMVRPFSCSNRNGFDKEGIPEGGKVPDKIKRDKALANLRLGKNCRKRKRYGTGIAIYNSDKSGSGRGIAELINLLTNE